jgi:polysaccharide deacetylase family protein (PEP-CTERM system associated)
MVNSRWTGPFERGIPNALTIEVEERWHATPARTEGEFRAGIAVCRLLDLLARSRARATFFVLGALAERQPEIVRMIHAAGHEIACHGHMHKPVGRWTPGEFRADLRQGRETLQDLVGTSVDAYRAPDFSLTPACRWALDVLIEEGFVFDSSIDPARHDRSGVLATPAEPYPISRPGGSLWELTPPVWPSLSSPRFDMYPLTRQGLRSANLAGRPFVVSLASWELDGQRALRTEERLCRLLADFAFAPASEVLARWYERAVPVRRAA